MIEYRNLFETFKNLSYINNSKTSVYMCFFSDRYKVFVDFI